MYTNVTDFTININELYNQNHYMKPHISISTQTQNFSNTHPNKRKTVQNPNVERNWGARSWLLLQHYTMCACVSTYTQ